MESSNLLQDKLDLIESEHSEFFKHGIKPVKYIEVIKSEGYLAFNTNYCMEHPLPDEIHKKMNEMINTFSSDSEFLNFYYEILKPS
jgi:hypothetical protein